MGASDHFLSPSGETAGTKAGTSTKPTRHVHVSCLDAIGPALTGTDPSSLLYVLQARSSTQKVTRKHEPFIADRSRYEAQVTVVLAFFRVFF